MSTNIKNPQGTYNTPGVGQPKQPGIPDMEGKGARTGNTPNQNVSPETRDVPQKGSVISSGKGDYGNKRS